MSNQNNQEQNPGSGSSPGQAQSPSSTGNPAAPNPLAGEVKDLSSQLAQAQQQVENLTTAQADLTQERDNLAEANQQLNEQVVGLQSQVTQFQADIQQRDGQITNWTTQHGQVNEQLATTNQALGETQAELNLYKQIAGDPKYHGLIGQVPAIKVAETPEQQVEILDLMAQNLGNIQQQAVQGFQSGGQPPAGGVSPNAPVQPGPANQLPTTVPETHAALQRVHPRTHPEQHKALMNHLNQLQYGNQQPQQPN